MFYRGFYCVEVGTGNYDNYYVELPLQAQEEEQKPETKPGYIESWPEPGVPVLPWSERDPNLDSRIPRGRRFRPPRCSLPPIIPRRDFPRG